jgi:hypothetical protein
MNNYIIILFLLVAKITIAQDRILVKQGDTLSVKITSLEKEKVIYFLINDVEKKSSEIPNTSLHKIIWRNGKEFMIDKEYDAKLPKSEAKVVSKKMADTPKLQEEVRKTENKSKIVPSELKINDWFFWKTYLSNGKRIGSDNMETLLLSLDYESYSMYSDGSEVKTYSKEKRYIGMIPGLRIIGLIGNIQYMKGEKIQKRAIRLYEQKRKANTLKSNLASP